MSDLQEGLLKGKKQTRQYKKRFADCELRIQTLRNKNNQLQKQMDNELESDIRRAIRQQSKFVEEEIVQIRRLIEQLSRDYKQPASKNKIKELLNKAGRQIDRNKRIMEDFVNRASNSTLRRSTMMGVSRVSRTQMEQDGRGIYSKEERHSASVIESEDLMNEVLMHQKMQEEKNMLIKQLQEKNTRINKVMAEMGEMVGGEQRDMIDNIEANIRDAHANVDETNQELDKARTYQKKAKKKYVCITVLIILIIAVVAGILVLFLK